ncbi:NAD-dependent epimerase/dehydratase family protein [Tardiphaga sp. 862_B3_N4_1]|jgi:nucleoside-diphosphate-sugar epimerase|uniref:NAD-dependent epimerase/dehydratase family protein n=1 Tax=Tardiphaga sp. 862_B3_N4_1 TaxID=3240764 RepID=UPI003F1FDEBE
MPSLVVGARGIVGAHIVRRLVKLGECPLALSRTPQEAADVRWIVGDLVRPDDLQLPPVSTIYCTAPVGLLADAIGHMAGSSLRRVVAFTSTSLVTKVDSEIESERDSVRSWAEDERRLIDACRRLGIHWTILRPTIIYDEGQDQNVTRIARLVERFGFFPLAGNGKGLRQPVHAEDLASGAVDAAASEAAIDKIYAVPGGEVVSYREMVGRIFDGLNRSRLILPIPLLLWKAALKLGAPFVPNTNVAMGSRMAKDMVFDGAPAARDFGWRPRGFKPRFRMPL